VTQAKNGQILLEGVPLKVGDAFLQFDLNNFNVSYRSDVEVDEDDSFLFTVIDSDGGWTGTHRFQVIFVDVGVSTTQLKNIKVDILPNPVKDLIYLKTNNNFALDGNLQVYNLQGQVVIEQSIIGTVREIIDTNALGSGFYFLKDSRWRKLRYN